MSFIYKITNQINNKIYIGKTNLTVQERFKEHCRDSKRTNEEKRPLYNAMNKYGIENFSIEQIEECSPDIINEREKYWILYYDSYNKGYNATCGGDGTQLYDYDIFSQEYLSGKTMTEISLLYNCDIHTVKKALLNKKIEVLSSSQQNKKLFSNPIKCIDIKTNEEKFFISQGEAAKWVIENNLSTSSLNDVIGKIGLVCKNKRKTAYGYKWTYK